ncbi:hypothetical protein ACFLRP_00245 [Bacteroidota bacterium]
MHKEELNLLIDFKSSGKPIESKELQLWIANSHNWQVELGCLNYLFAQILEGKSQDNTDCAPIINLVYDLVDHMYLIIHECNYLLVDYMLGFFRQPELSLEEELVQLHNDMSEYKYEQYIRY